MFELDCRVYIVFFFQAEDGIRDGRVTGVQTCALPISTRSLPRSRSSLMICRARGFDKPTAFAASTAVIGLVVIAWRIAASRSAAGARPADGRRLRRGLAVAAGAALAAAGERVAPVRARRPTGAAGGAAVAP